MGALDFIIYMWAPNINKVGIRLLGPIELLIALKTIYRAMSLLMSGSSTVII